MRKSKNVIGKDVLSYAGGAKLHSVKDLIVGMGNKSVVALLVGEGGLFSAATVVPMDKIVSFGKDAVMIQDNQSVIPADSYPAVREILDRKDKLIGKKVYTEGGDEHGSISDLYFDEKTGHIVGYEVSGGLLNNIAKGNSFLPVESIINMGEDVVLVHSEAVYDLEEQTGGVQGAMQKAGDKLGEATGAAQDKRSEVLSGSMFAVPGTQAARKPEDAALGRRASADVEADNGSIIVAAGQRIDADAVEEARAQGKLDALLAAAGLAQPQQTGSSSAGAALGQAGDKAGQVAGQVGEKAGEVAGQVGDKAGSLWDQLTGKISEMTDSAGKRVDEEKTKKRLSDMQDAIGRPVTKVILDKEDNVILNLGDIITHEAVQKAFDANMLDTMLESVYKGEVTFSKEEMMSPTEGEATVEKASGNAAIVDEMEQKVEQAQQEREEEKEQKKIEAEEKRQERQEERQQRSQG